MLDLLSKQEVFFSLDTWEDILKTCFWKKIVTCCIFFLSCQITLIKAEINDTEIELLPNSKNGFAILGHLGHLESK